MASSVLRSRLRAYPTYLTYLTYLTYELLLLSGCTLPDPRSPQSTELSLPEKVLVRTGGRIVLVPFEDYVLAAALSEVTPTEEAPATVERIYEVQAVLARTYAVSNLGRHHADGFDLCDSTHCQLYEPKRIQTSRFTTVARSAVRRTAGTILTYGRRPVEALFHADCGGYTDSADAVWGGPPVPYLLASPDETPGAPHRSWKVTIPVGDLRAILNADPRTRVGRRLTGVQIARHDVSGRAAEVTVIGETRHDVRGEDLRAVVDRKLGDHAIQSTRFSITRTGTAFVFQGTGFGHGVGLCQFGAAARARRGDSLETILMTYFKNTRLTNLD